MAPSSIGSVSLVLLSCFLLFSSDATAFNITKLLDRYPDYKTFNDLLTQTKLSDEINHRQTITVLAVSDAEISPISGKPIESVKNILMNHVVLDYYDMQKLKNLKKGTSLLTTLFQTTGVASYQQGFLNVTNKDGQILFGSAVKGAGIDIKLNKLVASQPYNISLLEVSGPIIAPGLDGVPIGPVMAPKKPIAPAPAPPKNKHAPAKSPAAEEEAEAEAPAGEEAKAPEAPSEAPASSPAPSEDDKPAADEPQSPPPSNSSSSNGFVSSFGSLVVFLVSLVAAL